MKPGARDNFIKTLSKENLEINLNELSDKELKGLYVKWQKLRQGHFKYQMLKGENFEDVLKEGRLQYVSFRNTPGVRILTLQEYLQVEEFIKTNRNKYPMMRKL